MQRSGASLFESGERSKTQRCCTNMWSLGLALLAVTPTLFATLCFVLVAHVGSSHVFTPWLPSEGGNGTEYAVINDPRNPLPTRVDERFR